MKDIGISAQGARALDAKAQRHYAVPALLLMENAGRQVAEEALRILGKYGRQRRNAVAVFCGKGNNGADGLCACRHLLTRGITCEAWLVAGSCRPSEEARKNLTMLLRLGQRVRRLDGASLPLVRKRIASYRLIIDAPLGVGLSGVVSGVYAGLIPIINSSKAHVLSVDVPSGLDATTGKAHGVCVRAHTTVTFVAKKRGMLKDDGKRLCGRIVVADLGVPLL